MISLGALHTLEYQHGLGYPTRQKSSTKRLTSELVGYSTLTAKLLATRARCFMYPGCALAQYICSRRRYIIWDAICERITGTKMCNQISPANPSPNSYITITQRASWQYLSTSQSIVLVSEESIDACCATALDFITNWAAVLRSNITGYTYLYEIINLCMKRLESVHSSIRSCYN